MKLKILKLNRGIRFLLRSRIPKVGLAILLIFALASSYFLFFNSKPVKAAWWNDSWQYRKSIAVTNNTSGGLTDFQVKVLSAVDLTLVTILERGKINSMTKKFNFSPYAKKKN